MAKKADDLFKQFSDSLAVKKPTGHVGSGPDALDYLRTGGALVCLRPTKLNGRVFEIGDTYNPPEDHYVKIAKLVELGHFTTLPAWENGKKYNVHKKFFQNEVVPIHSRLQAERQKKMRATAAVAEAEALLAQAKSELRDASEHEKMAEEQLSQLLEGRELL